MSALTDFKALLVAHSVSPTFAANAALSGEPNIRLISEAIGAAVNGLIQINELNVLPPTETFHTQTIPNRIGVTVEFDGQTVDTKITALIEEIQKAMTTNNHTSPRDYYYSIESREFSGIVIMGQYKLIVSAIREDKVC